MKASSAEPPPGAGLREQLQPASQAVIRVGEACGFLARARGLLARPVLAPGCGLLLRNVRAVHGIGMRHAIDLVFLDERFAIVRCATLAPWQVARCAMARHVLEMAAGEVVRLQLRIGSRPILLPGALAFRCHCGGSCAHPRCRSLPRAPLLLVLLLCVAGSASVAVAQDASAPADARLGRAGASSVAAGSRPDADGALDQEVLRRLQGEADRLYHDSAPNEADEELLRLYQSLANAAPQRAYQAWLRIGNIHQRAGAVGAAIDAYRLALQAEAAGHTLPSNEEDARRKSLLNLASLALDQARQALATLSSLPTTNAQAEQLQLLQRQYEAQQRRIGDGSAAGAGHAEAAAPAGIPQFIERYTASGRRNAVKSARGSLHLHPADDLPAKPVPTPRSRHRREPLPDVEYLLGDPQRLAPAADAHAPDGRRRKSALPRKKPVTGQASKAAEGDR